MTHRRVAPKPVASSPPAGRRSSSAGRGYGLFLLPGLVSCTLVIIVPFLMNIGVSFTRWQGVGRPTWIGAANYARLLSDTVFWVSFTNNLALIVAMAVVPTAIGLLLAAVLFDSVSRTFGRRTASFFRAGFYLPQILPVAIAGVVWGWILQPKDGALNWLLRAAGLGWLARNWLGDARTAMLSVMGIMVWFQIGYPLVIFMAGLQRIDPELYEAAALDGATWSQRFAHITVPMIRPELFVVLLTTTIAALKIFGQIYVLTRGGPGSATIVPSYFAYQNFFEKANVGYGAAIATIMTIIILILTVVFIKLQSRQELAEGI